MGCHRGLELLSISTITSGSPFTVYSGVQQTDAGTNGVDRPDQVGIPHLSTSRKVRQDYFGLGANNASYFSIPINVPGGTGPNHGLFGTLGRNTFRGPAYYGFDFALIKSTPIRLARVVLSGSICSFALNSSTSSTSSTWACRPTPFSAPASVKSAAQPALPGKLIFTEAHLLRQFRNYKIEIG